TQVYGRFCEVRVARCGTALGDEEALGAFVLLRNGSSIGCGRGFLQVACLDHGWSAVSLLPSRLKPDRTLFPDEVQDRQVGRRGPESGTEELLYKAPRWLRLRPPPPARSDRNEREGPRVARREGREPWPGHVRQRLPSGRSSHGWRATSRWVNCDAASMLRGRTSRSGWQSAWPRGQSLRADRQPATAEQSRSGSLGVPVPR